jgi:hypothetical protein
MGQRRHLLRLRRAVHRPGPAPALPGRWRGVISPGSGPDSRRIRRKVSGKTKASVADRLAQLHRDLDAGARPAPAKHTVRQAAEDWLAYGPRRWPAKTVRKNKDVLEPILSAVGARRLTELTSADVDAASAKVGQALRRGPLGEAIDG